MLVRDLQHLADAFAVHPTYIHEDKELSGHGIDLGMLGPQFSRGFQALKVWVSQSFCYNPHAESDSNRSYSLTDRFLRAASSL